MRVHSERDPSLDLPARAAAAAAAAPPPLPCPAPARAGCPFCRKAREVVNYLDLDVLFLPCPKVCVCVWGGWCDGAGGGLGGDEEWWCSVAEPAQGATSVERETALAARCVDVPPPSTPPAVCRTMRAGRAHLAP